MRHKGLTALVPSGLLNSICPVEATGSWTNQVDTSSGRFGCENVVVNRSQ